MHHIRTYWGPLENSLSNSRRSVGVTRTAPHQSTWLWQFSGKLLLQLSHLRTHTIDEYVNSLTARGRLHKSVFQAFITSFVGGNTLLWFLNQCTQLLKVCQLFSLRRYFIPQLMQLCRSHLYVPRSRRDVSSQPPHASTWGFKSFSKIRYIANRTTSPLFGNRNEPFRLPDLLFGFCSSLPRRLHIIKETPYKVEELSARSWDWV